MLTFLSVCIGFYCNISCATQENISTKTPTGISLDADWKRAIYEFAQKNVKHPAWGLAHSERDYRVTQQLAQKDGVNLDDDVLFAAAFLHDVGGIAPFDKKGVDHAVQSVSVIEPLLLEWGFPMQKFSQVKELIIGHVYYGPPPDSKAAQAFRDADILDFLGSIGIARVLAITEEDGGSSATLGSTVGLLKDFSQTLASKCSLESCKEMSKQRQKELEQFLLNLNEQSFGGLAL